jgi:hypothetical protein
VREYKTVLGISFLSVYHICVCLNELGRIYTHTSANNNNNNNKNKFSTCEYIYIEIYMKCIGIRISTNYIYLLLVVFCFSKKLIYLGHDVIMTTRIITIIQMEKKSRYKKY